MPSERFQIPEPSEAAYDKFFERTDEKWLNHIASCVRHAYAVDLPGIVRAEVDRALVEANLAFGVHSSNVEWRERYLSTRFDAPSAEGERCEDVDCASPGAGVFIKEWPTPPEGEPNPCYHSAWVMGCPSCAQAQTQSRPTPPSREQMRCVSGCGYQVPASNRCEGCPDTSPFPSAAKDCGFCADKEPHRAEDCSYGRGLPLKEPPGVSPPSATGEPRSGIAELALIGSDFDAVRCVPCGAIYSKIDKHRCCTACGCAACHADRAFVRALASAYINFPGLAPDTPTQVAARAVTEAR